MQSFTGLVPKDWCEAVNLVNTDHLSYVTIFQCSVGGTC